MNVLSELQKVERSWLIPLYNTCQRAFSQAHLPSHNEDHHLRVWITARELIKQLEKQAITFTRSDLTKIIIAAFLHDTGMSVTIDKTHGKESRKICKKFIEEYKPEDIDNPQELLDVIENHDDKEYQNKFAKIKNPKHLFKILSVCDD
ncbi:MAG: HD domain-containing protein, partial [Bacteroidales bacterium]|nr:HD domain-containing protein [Bacteroidales bacterium]